MIESLKLITIIIVFRCMYICLLDSERERERERECVLVY